MVNEESFWVSKVKIKAKIKRKMEWHSCINSINRKHKCKHKRFCTCGIFARQMHRTVGNQEFGHDELVIKEGQGHNKVSSDVRVLKSIHK